MPAMDRTWALLLPSVGLVRLLLGRLCQGMREVSEALRLRFRIGKTILLDRDDSA
jgi:hypothetical protein